MHRRAFQLNLMRELSKTILGCMLCVGLFTPVRNLAAQTTNSFTQSYSTYTLQYSPTDYGVSQSRTGGNRTVAAVSAPVKPVATLKPAPVNTPKSAPLLSQTASVVNSLPQTKTATTTPQLPKTGGGGKSLSALASGGMSLLNIALTGILLFAVGATCGLKVRSKTPEEISIHHDY